MSKLDTLTDADLEHLAEVQNRIAEACTTRVWPPPEPDADTPEWAARIAGEHADHYMSLAVSLVSISTEQAVQCLRRAEAAGKIVNYSGSAERWFKYIRQVCGAMATEVTRDIAADRKVFESYMDGDSACYAARRIQER